MYMTKWLNGMHDRCAYCGQTHCEAEHMEQYVDDVVMTMMLASMNGWSLHD